MRLKKRLLHIMLTFILVCSTLYPSHINFNTNAEEQIISGCVQLGRTDINFRKTAGGDLVTDSDGNHITLDGGHPLRILDTSNKTWTKVLLYYNDVEYTGYIYSEYVTIYDGTSNDVEMSEDLAFEVEMMAQGFPESYKVQLRAIHEQYPEWKFEAIHTGIEWQTLLDNELNKKGQVKNLVWTASYSPNYNWRSTNVGYDYATDKWTPYDSTMWFAASDELVTYYLDPRTYLDKVFIFTFESLSYYEDSHNAEGVEAILDGTFMHKKIPAGETRTYAEIIVEAAKQTGVSPYHIASRIRLEMGAKENQCALGTNSTYPGIYNFFNIGATDTANGDPSLKGLAWASKEGSYGRPWDSVEKAIVGGAEFLGKSYISVGQDTLYTQKFNVTNKGSLFSHQYMTNVQAPATECQSSYTAYKDNDMLDGKMVFKIPVYVNMPEKKAVKPSSYGNPNNWLATLSISGYTLTPEFGKNWTSNYSLTVRENVESISISATTVNSNAKISGTGTVKLNEGENKIIITVTAQNGAVRKYTLTVTRGNKDIISSSGNSVTKGDLNDDQKISALDIVYLQRLIVLLDETDDTSLAKGDINDDGKISALDIVCVQRHIVGLEMIE